MEWSVAHPPVATGLTPCRTGIVFAARTYVASGGVALYVYLCFLVSVDVERKVSAGSRIITFNVCVFFVSGDEEALLA